MKATEVQTMDRINMGIHISFPVGSIGCSIAKLKIKLNTPTVPICTMAIVMESTATVYLPTVIIWSANMKDAIKVNKSPLFKDREESNVRNPRPRMAHTTPMTAYLFGLIFNNKAVSTFLMWNEYLSMYIVGLLATYCGHVTKLCPKDILKEDTLFIPWIIF